MTFKIGIFSIALLSVIPCGSGYFTYGNFPVHTTYFPSYAYPRTFVAPSLTTLPAIPGYRLSNTGTNPFQVGFAIKTEDLCANQGILRTLTSPGRIKSPGPFFLPKLHLLPKPADENGFTYTVARSQGKSEWTDEQRENIHSYFTFFDDDGSGTMTFQEFNNLWQYFMAAGSEAGGSTLLETNFAIQVLFYLADSDSSGALSENEYATFLKKLSQQDVDAQSSIDDWTAWTKEEVGKAMFHTIDEDHDGSVSIDELNQGMIMEGYVLTVFELRQVRQSLDTNYDGLINYNEISPLLWSDCFEPLNPLTGIKSPGQGGRRTGVHTY